MKLLAVHWLLMSLLPLSAVAQNGVIIFKDNPWQADQFVSVVPYRRVEKFPTVHNVTPMKGEKLRINSALVLKDVAFPRAGAFAEIHDEDQLKPIEALITEWTTVMRRFPSSTKYLAPRIAGLQAEVAKFHEGKVKSAGAWMTKEALAAKKKALEEERERLARKSERDLKEQQQAAADYDAAEAAKRQQLEDAKLRAEEARLRVEEERRIREAIERQERAAAERAKLKPAERLRTDVAVRPKFLTEAEASEYEKEIKAAREELAKAKLRLGYGLEAKRLVLVAPDRVYAFWGQDLVCELTPPASPEGEASPRAIVLRSQKEKHAIEVFPISGRDSEWTSSVEIPLTPAMDGEKLTHALSRILVLTSEKPESEKESPQ